jgi:hypothetical protein
LPIANIFILHLPSDNGCPESGDNFVAAWVNARHVVAVRPDRE